MSGDIAGTRFGRLVAIGREPKQKGQPRRCQCRCDCGRTTSVRVGNLRSGAVTSCGCSRHTDVSERFWDKVEKTSGCWNWTASKTVGGYGNIKVAGRRWTMAHRLSYEMLVGPIPSGFHIDHLCRNRACVNPSHLEPVTCAENLRRARPFRSGIRRKKSKEERGGA